ncbi:MAG: aminotransferase class III-fold pyridoxal phosphate-dependent enzyme [Vicinamibacterales bacterium]
MSIADGLAELERLYADSRPRSRALFERARQVMPSGVVHDARAIAPFPFYVDRAEGTVKWDVDGHAYIDAWSGHGSLMLGHQHPAVLDGIARQLSRGLHYGACHELEVRWAELVTSIVPGAERVRFTTTGTETTALALRVARAATGRTHVLKLEGHFHGVHDYGSKSVKVPFDVPMSAGVPASTLESVLIAPHNDLARVAALLDAHAVAAVILEPAGAHSAVAPPSVEFLRGLRALTARTGAVLVFDEVVSGFRLAPGGAQEYFGVTADLACFAKAIAGGLPGAALAGRADLMEYIAFSGDPERDRHARVADQGTHSAAPLIAAAGVATLEILKTGDVQRRLNALADRLRAGWNAALRRRSIPGIADGTASIFRVFLGATAEELGLTGGAVAHARLDKGMGPLGVALHLAMLLEGVDFARGASIGWLNGAMSDTTIDDMIERFDRALARLERHGLLPAPTKGSADGLAQEQA